MTPGSGHCPVWSSLIIGAGAAVCSYYFCTYKARFMPIYVDDTLDVFGCHGVSGIWGVIATGLFASDEVNPSNKGIDHNGAFFGNPTLLGKQIVGILACSSWSFSITYLIAIIINGTIKLQLDDYK